MRLCSAKHKTPVILSNPYCILSYHLCLSILFICFSYANPKLSNQRSNCLISRILRILGFLSPGQDPHRRERKHKALFNILRYYFDIMMVKIMLTLLMDSPSWHFLIQIIRQRYRHITCLNFKIILTANTILVTAIIKTVKTIDPDIKCNETHMVVFIYLLKNSHNVTQDYI